MASLSFTTSERLRVAGPCDHCLVLDGSGSMSGDAIAQSHDLYALSPKPFRTTNRIQILRSGSRIVPSSRRQLRASVRVQAMVSLVDTVNSDLGGTGWVMPCRSISR